MTLLFFELITSEAHTSKFFYQNSLAAERSNFDKKQWYRRLIQKKVWDSEKEYTAPPQ